MLRFFRSGDLERLTLPNGARITQAYDQAGRLSDEVVRQSASSGSTKLASWVDIVYNFNDNRRTEQVTQRQVSGASLSGQGESRYDRLERLTRSEHPFETGHPTAYSLDDAGNIDNQTGFVFNPGTAQYDPADYQLQYVNNFLTTRTPTNPAGAAEIFDYDDFGNQISQTGSDPSTNTYDAASHPASTTKGGTTVSFTYDGLGRMATRTEGAETTLFFHDGSADQISVEKNPADQVTTSYLLDADRTPVGQDVNGVRAWYVLDPRGNLTQLLDDSAGVQAVFGYDPYGKTKDNLTHTDKPSGWDSRLRFQMAPRDPKTGNYNLGSRLLDPAINRFVGADFYAASSANVELQLDPLTGNRYMYAGANPAGLIDDGHGAWSSLRNMATKAGKSAVTLGKRALNNSIVRGVVTVAVVGASYRSVHAPDSSQKGSGCSG